jgi:hypothetical protein
MLSKVAHYNDLSPELRKELKERIKGFGKSVRFKFNIEKPNPDKTNYNGKTIWPNNYVLDPKVVTIKDRDDSIKQVGIVLQTDEKGLPKKFGKITIGAGERGIKFFDLNKADHLEQVSLLLLHPKLAGGLFQDKDRIPVVSIIDEVKDATEKRKERSASFKALNAAQTMSDKEVRQFADAQSWDSTQEIEVLRNMVEELAEAEPQFFNDLVGSKKLELQALVKQAIDRRVIGFDPAENKFIWSDSNQTIIALGGIPAGTQVEKMAEWLQTAGEKADTVLGKIKGLLKKS